MKHNKIMVRSMLIAFFVVQTSIWCMAETEVDNKYYLVFAEKFRAFDFDGAASVLKEWEKVEPNNPALYISYFSYYAYRSAKQGYGRIYEDLSNRMGERLVFNLDDIKIALKYLDKAINIAPDRLSYYCNKIEFSFEIEDYKTAGDTICAVLVDTKRNSEKWALAEDENYVLETMDKYYYILINHGYSGGVRKTKNSFNEVKFETETQLKRCLETQIKLFPKDMSAFNYYGMYYFEKNDAQNALQWFLKGENIAPKDSIVLINIGRTYAKLGDKKKSKQYYDKVISLGQNPYKDIAKDLISEL